MGKCKRLLTMVLAAVLCCTMLPVTAFAGGGPEDGSDKVLEYWSQGSTPPQDIEQTGQPTAQPSAQPTIESGEPLSQGSEFSTRDLLYDKETHKQFITVEGRDGNTFYIVIDYDAPVNKKEEQYQAYFLNKVDEADLAVLVVALAGGGAVYFLKFKKKKPGTKGSANLDVYDYGDEDEHSDAEDEPEDGEDE